MCELLTVREVAAKMKISSRHLWGLLSAGRAPKIVRIGRSVRLLASDVDLWIKLGCPSRDALEAEKAKEGGVMV